VIFIKSYEKFITKIPITVGDNNLNVIVSKTPQEQKRGYMFSRGPKEGEGMLFIYPKEQILSFWMKNVKIPLDILFFDSNCNLIGFEKMKPQFDDEKIKYYTSKLPAKYALEVRSGWISDNIKTKKIKLKF